MTDIEAKALALVREVLAERDLSDKRAVRREVSPYTEALCRAIEQHEAYKQEVSDALAILIAIREPSEAMKEKGFAAYYDTQIPQHPIIAAFTAMIDEAFKEQSK